MEIYYGIFYPLQSGGFGVRFPDAPAIHTAGKNIDEALEMAVDALSGLMVMGRKGREYQEPRGHDAVFAEAKSGELVFPVMPNEKNMEAYRPKKRVNVMIPADLLEKIDALRDQKGLDRSRLICDAVEAQLSHADV